MVGIISLFFYLHQAHKKIASSLTGNDGHTHNVVEEPTEVDGQNVNEEIVSIGDAKKLVEIPLNTVFREMTSGKIRIEAKADDNEASYFNLHISCTNSEVQTKFVQVPHHPIRVKDKDSFNAIGFLYAWDTSKTEKGLNVPEKTTDNEKVHSINIPKKVMEAFDYKAHILVYSNQGKVHSGRTHGDDHIAGHPILDPRGGG